jgi:hypothetical protein
MGGERSLVAFFSVFLPPRGVRLAVQRQFSNRED